MATIWQHFSLFIKGELTDPVERPIPTPDGFDSTFYLPGMESVPRKIAIVRANRYVVDHVDYLIAYVWHPASNVRELLEYVQRRERKGKIAVSVLQHNFLPAKN